MFNINYLRIKGTDRFGDAQINSPDIQDKDEISEDIMEQYLPAPEVSRMVSKEVLFRPRSVQRSYFSIFN